MNKIPVSILGATGSVGQKFIQLLENHPYFYISSIAASDKSVGKKYSDAVNWILPTLIPKSIGDMIIDKCESNLKSKIVFSGLDSKVAGEIEENFAQNNYLVISNSKNHRFDDDVPLLIPEVNPAHINLLKTQKFTGGGIVTNPNCSTIGLAIALKPLINNFEVEQVNVVTLQALSGAGYPGVSSLDIIDNVIPYIEGEEEKIELEPKKIFGKLNNGRVDFADLRISAQCNRVAVIDGHLESVQIKFKVKPTIQDIISSWENFTALPQQLNLPSAPVKPIYYFNDEKFPQPRLHRNLDKGMAVSIGRLRQCSIFDYKFSILSHNTIRGAAGGAILCAELLVAKEYIK
jgi:aspartate-semialdehyde dehydrogenase